MRKFISDKSFNDYVEISEINENTGDMLTYCKDRETGIEYRKFYENIFEIGWESIDEFIKNRHNKAWGYVEVKWYVWNWRSNQKNRNVQRIKERKWG